MKRLDTTQSSDGSVSGRYHLAGPTDAGDYVVKTSLTPRTHLVGSNNNPHGRPLPMDVSLPVYAPIVLVEANPISGFGGFVKRTLDVVMATSLVLMFSWLLLGIAIGIKATSHGPIVFRQERRGRNGTTFRCFKFRSMYVEETDFDSAVQTRVDDPRITPLGRFLRKHSLDELPQLVNVIIGHMSLVGPRPHALGTSLDGRLLHEAMPDYPLRYRVRPGLTGWAQVNGWRGIIDTQEKLEKRVEFDLHYIANWSPLLDLQILLRTFTCLFADERAY